MNLGRCTAHRGRRSVRSARADEVVLGHVVRQKQRRPHELSVDADGLEFLFGALHVDRVRQFGAESDDLQLARHGVGFLDGNFTVNDTDESD
ncbi:hypothetical protein PC129_g4394 [Phytophthora cactorum]|uniref:Uncharacterized protein n=2 Tax=Phytophthora cactorum TaxID=29920 RepID=A0A8T1DYW4_9STRA|nr:hypothetical protein PC111_g19101 [Phytophthora cactorum]KAG2945009.1 hypothetical protein PC117_g8830 [Phytophthora cactorum]KAG2999757.1 hypothetical protein PC120_g20854 [Phytophthora cactorum]KAG3094458.1 hypothetical protein PC122_g5757 [Phytophthora cactorum]KAG3122243.1 hypothetical protein PC128_g27805 [Phytophthora cactorum]